MKEHRQSTAAVVESNVLAANVGNQKFDVASWIMEFFSDQWVKGLCPHEVRTQLDWCDLTRTVLHYTAV